MGALKARGSVRAVFCVCSLGLAVGSAGGLALTAPLSAFSAAARADADAAFPNAEPSPVPLDLDFLNLRAFDLERVDGPAELKVGDSVVMRIAGLNGLSAAGAPIREPMKELKLVAPPGADSLTDQGWSVSIEDSAPAAPGELRIRVTPLKAGSLTLPSLAIVGASFEEPGSGPGAGPDEKDPANKPAPLARTNPVTIQVSSAIQADDPKPDQPAELRPPVSLRFPWWVIALAGLIACGALVGGVIAYRRWRAKKPRAALARPAEPPKPEDEIALSALAELEKSGPLRRGEFKAHYFRVSEILKAYIGARYDFDASESTTREMIGRLEDSRSVEDARLDRLETLFEKLDLVKFTDHVPLPDEGGMVLESAREFVRGTRRPPVPASLVPGGEGASLSARHPAPGRERSR
jgi:hypothetical protein